MTDQKKPRRQKLEEILASNPNDAFALYGLALECRNSGDFAAAESHFRALLQSNPDYVPGYQMYAQTLAQNNRPVDAKSVLIQGILVAKRAGNHHALSEMESLLSDLS
jgi:cytochrome c-type biogenesis protein CcmH/NrfG